MKSILQDKRSGRCYICEHWRNDDSIKSITSFTARTASWRSGMD